MARAGLSLFAEDKSEDVSLSFFSRHRPESIGKERTVPLKHRRKLSRLRRRWGLDKPAVELPETARRPTIADEEKKRGAAEALNFLDTALSVLRTVFLEVPPCSLFYVLCSADAVSASRFFLGRRREKAGMRALARDPSL